MNEHYYGVIMAGGVGSRFWPLSREERPKQFLDLTGSGKTFLRQAYERLLGVIPEQNILVVSLTRYKDAVMESIPELPQGNLLLEPYGRNTAPCLAYAMYSLLQRDPQAVMLICPSDHLITNVGLFRHTVSEALDYAAANDALITLGIVPDRADTNFGYIQAVGGKGAYEHTRPVRVKTFTEKPDAELAQVFIRTGEFLWNSGIFAWKASVIKEEMERYVPQVTNLFKGWEEHIGKASEAEFLERAYTDMERISIDYAVMEKTERDWLFAANFGWADIGNWESLYKYISSPDEAGNVTNASHTLMQGSRRNIIVTHNPDKLVALGSLEGFVVIDSEDVLMICPRNDKKLKEITTHIGLPDFEDFR